MSDDAGAARAASEPFALPVNGTEQSPQNNDAAQLGPIVDRAQETARASVDRAFAALDSPGTEGEPNSETTLSEPGRDERGRFKAKEQQPEEKLVSGSLDLNAPQGFSVEAKAAWASVPENVRAETNRTFNELNEGLTRYRDIIEPLKPYQELADKVGTTMHEALGRYVALDMALLSKKPEERMDAIARVLTHSGLTPRDYAQQIVAQKPEEASAGGDQALSGLRKEIADLREELGGLSHSFARRRGDEVKRDFDAFAERNPRLKEKEVMSLVARLISAGIAPDLPKAYDMAVRFSPEPTKPTQPAADTANRKPAAPARNGNLSISGAPGAGSNPAKRKAPLTARESVDNAFTSLGIV
jgi:hypothetical protein